MGKDIERLVRTYAQLEMDILLDMARKLGKFDLYIPSTVYQHQKLVQMGLVYDEIVLRLSAALKKTPAEIEKIIKEAGADSLKNDLNIYEKAATETTETAKAARERPTRMRLEEVRKHIDKVISGTAAVAFEAESKAIANIINEGFRRTNGAFENLTRTTANTATRQFERALDRAYMQVSSGAFSGGRATEMAIKDLAAKGIESLVYPSGHVDTMEVAARRAIITGVNNTNLHLKDELAEQLGLNLVEVSAHAGARPSHAVWQGKIYSRKGATDKYPNLAEATGYGTGPGLGGWNCNHTMSPYYEGMPRAYTDERLEEYSNDIVEINGEKVSRYEANQKMRNIERHIRQWKREAAALEAGGQDGSRARAKVIEWSKKWQAFSTETKIKLQSDRVTIGKNN